MRSEVAEATRAKLVLLRRVEGDIAAGTTTTAMTFAAARARLTMAAGLLSIGDQLLASGLAQGNVYAVRSAISRFYYGMFQAARAVVFIDFGGDDNNAHQELPKKLPSGLPNRAYWVNELKSARLRRNDADYDPYPVTAADWQADATALQGSARDFVVIVDAFLTARGV